SLLGHGPTHGIGQLDVLDLHDADLHTPRLGQLVDDLLELAVDVVAVDEKLIEVDLADDAPECGLGDLEGPKPVVLDLEDGAVGVCYPEIAHGVDAYGHVVTRNDVLGWDVECHGPQTHPHQPIDDGDDEDQTRSPSITHHPTEPEQDAPLVF